MRPEHALPVETADGPGVTRFHFIGNTEAEPAACDRARRWCTDRAVPAPAADRIVLLVRAATSLALELDPRRVAVGMRWLDADRVVVDVCSRGRATSCSAARARAARAGSSTIVFDAASEGWGLQHRATESVHWFVVNTQS